MKYKIFTKAFHNKPSKMDMPKRRNFQLQTLFGILLLSDKQGTFNIFEEQFTRL